MNDAEKQNLVDLLDSLVIAAVPKATKVAKYGGTLYTLRPQAKEGKFWRRVCAARTRAAVIRSRRLPRRSRQST